MMHVRYNVGGYDPGHPNGNVAEVIERTGATEVTRTVYGPDGTVDFVQVLPAEYEPEWGSLDATGALATLLVVEGVLTLDDAAAALRERPEHLIHEAQAWQVAADAGT